MRSRPAPIRGWALAGVLALAACGEDDDASPATDAVVATPATDVADPEPSPTDAPSIDTADADSADEPESEPDPVVDDAPAATAAGEPAAEPDPEPEPEPEPPPVAIAEIGGRDLGAEVQAAADVDTNPFPDLLVHDVGRDTQVNIRNILPSDRPVLLWTWAPH